MERRRDESGAFWRRLLSGASSVLIASMSTLSAAEIEDHSAGQRLAQRWCTECHDIRPGRFASPNLRAPSFTDLANDPALTEFALRALLRKPHDTMPQILFTGEQMDDIVGYVLSIGRSKN
jgi:mono/diheme cytochrome c family protein